MFDVLKKRRHKFPPLTAEQWAAAQYTRAAWAAQSARIEAQRALKDFPVRHEFPRPCGRVPVFVWERTATRDFVTELARGFRFAPHDDDFALDNRKACW